MSQLATMAQVTEIVGQLNVANAGGGVKEWYIPDYSGPWVAPEMGDQKFYHLRFKCGAQGFNVGLLWDLRAMFPLSWTTNVNTEIEYQLEAMKNQV